MYTRMLNAFAIYCIYCPKSNPKINVSVWRMVSLQESVYAGCVLVRAKWVKRNSGAVGKHQWAKAWSRHCACAAVLPPMQFMRSYCVPGNMCVPWYIISINAYRGDSIAGALSYFGGYGCTWIPTDKLWLFGFGLSAYFAHTHTHTC